MGWENVFLHTGQTTYSCGVMTLVRKDLDFEDESCLCDPGGGFIILNATVQHLCTK